MDFFSCNNCKRYRRRTVSSDDEENEDSTVTVRQRTTLRRGSGGGTSGTPSGPCGKISLCCATAMVYCYAARAGRRETRSRSAKTISGGRRTGASQWSSTDGFAAVGVNLELPQLHHSSSPKSRSPAPKGSILKNSSSSNDLGSFTVSGNATPTSTLTSRTGNWFADDNGTTLNIRRSASPEKRASFNEAVDVIVADETGRQIIADSVRLKPPSSGCDDSDSETDLGRKSHISSNSTSSPFGSRGGSGRKGGSASGRRKQQHTTYVYPPASRCRHAFSLASADVERRPDGSRYLRAVIRPTTSGSQALERDGETIGTTGDRSIDESQRQRRSQQHQQSGGGSERVFVRAAAKGSRLVVDAYRPEPLGDGTNYLRQYVDRFSLPRVIEKQSIRADLQPTGVLVVTAAINESSDTDTD